jgi:nitrogen fixation protein NifU and related proteins
MSDLNKLYDPVIKAHHANPYHFEKIADASNTIKAYNPVCGDRYDFFADVADQKIINLHFHGFGCAVSMAAGSVLVKSLEGKSIDEAISLCNSYLDLLNGKQSSIKTPEEYRAFMAVRDFPARYECAAMAWMEMRKFLMKFV